ncbi:MAG: cyclic nucleotide-binding/CBS domain-containing protein [Haloglomus sp.]
MDRPLDIPVSECMSTPLRTVTPDLPVGAAAEVLRQERIGSVVVTDEAGDIAGIVTESDMVRSVGADHDTDRMTVDRLMTKDVVTIGLDATLKTACDRMAEHDVKRLPVVAEEPVGIVTTTDLTHELAQSFSDTLAPLE